MISWELRDTGESGQGMFATRLIQPGETILEDWQYFDVKGKYAPEWIFTLKNSIPEMQQVQGIIATNQINIGNEEVVVYKTFSKFNHSCNPNAENFTNKKTMVIVAIKPIFPGEEITISYYKSLRFLDDIEEIHEYTKKFWRFDCNCTLEQSPWRPFKDELKEMLKGIECINEARLDELIPLITYHHPIVASFILAKICEMYLKAEMHEKAQKYRTAYVQSVGHISHRYPDSPNQLMLFTPYKKEE